MVDETADFVFTHWDLEILPYTHVQLNVKFWKHSCVGIMKA
jgi:hypothetical protein